MFKSLLLVTAAAAAMTLSACSTSSTTRVAYSTSVPTGQGVSNQGSDLGIRVVQDQQAYGIGGKVEGANSDNYLR